MHYDIFISHSSRSAPQEYELVDRLYYSLKARKFEVFLDRKCLKDVDDAISSIMRALNLSKFVILIYSAKSAESRWVSFELDEILRLRACRKIILLVLRLENVLKIPFKINSNNIISCCNPYNVYSITNKICKLVN